MRVHTWEDPEIYQIWTVNQANQNDWPKETQKKYYIKIIQTATMTRLSNTLGVYLCGCPQIFYFFSLLINTWFGSLLSIFVGILFCKAKESGPLSLTIGLVASIWCSSRWDLASISSWEPKPHSKPSQAEATRDHIDHPGEAVFNTNVCVDA